MSSWLDRLAVTAPCRAPWDEMRGDGNVRFCDRCRKNVYDLSDMTRDEAERLIAEAEGDPCVRFRRRPDGTVVTRACAEGSRPTATPGLRAIGGAVLSLQLASGAARADLATTGKSDAKRPAPRARAAPPPPPLEHVPSAPPDATHAATMGAVDRQRLVPPIEGVRACYQKELARRPDLAGKLVLRFVVQGGRVERSDVDSSTLADRELERCVLDDTRAWRFPTAQAAITVIYPLAFTPAR